MKKIDAILHPVRFRIIQSFLDGQHKTTKELVKKLHDIPQATLYRQLDTLVKAGILTIIEEKPIRGTVEKVYSLSSEELVLRKKDIVDVTREEHLQYFLLFTAQLVKDFEAYLQKDEIDFERDGAGYRQVALHLTEQEFLELSRELSAVMQKYVNNPPAQGRTKRIISVIAIPEYERGTADEQESGSNHRR